jgi:HEAT repeat protein
MSRLLPLVAGCAVLLACSATAARQDKEKDDPKDPTYDGRKASVWIDTLINGTSARQRALAVEALGHLWAEKRYENAVPNIGRALRVDSSAAVRTQAAVALGSLREADVNYFISERESLGVKDLVDAMGSEKESRVRKEIARAIGRFPVVARRSVPQLTRALKDADAGTRAAAAEAIALAGGDGKSAAAELAPLLDDSDAAARRAAVVALGRVSPAGSSAVAEKMAKMLGTEKDPDLRRDLIVSLGLLDERSPAVVSALAAVLSEKETEPDGKNTELVAKQQELRRRAARTLGAFGPAAAAAADTLLKTAATDRLKDIRVDAVHGFGSAVGPAVLKVRVKDLLGLLSDPDFEVRIAVVEEIGALGNELMKDEETIRTLRKRLSDPHVKVRETVATALRKIEIKAEPKKESPPKKP